MASESCVEKRIIWLASYPRSGNTWLRFLISAYADGAVEAWNTCNNASADIHGFAGHQAGELLDQEQLRTKIAGHFGRLPASRFRSNDYICKSHFQWTDQHPLASETSKVIHLVRHPKDVLLSTINFQRLMAKESVLTDQDAAKQFIDAGGNEAWERIGYGTWFEHFDSWNNVGFPKILIRYERLKQDTLGEFLRLIEFLDLPVDEERVKQAVEQTSLLKLRKLEVEAREQNRFLDVSENHYFNHKGQTGQSLAHLGADIEKYFDDRFAGWLHASGYGDRVLT